MQSGACRPFSLYEYSIWGVSSRVRQNTGRSRCEPVNCDSQSLELIAATVVTSLFSTFENQGALHADGCCRRAEVCWIVIRHQPDSLSFRGVRNVLVFHVKQYCFSTSPGPRHPAPTPPFMVLAPVVICASLADHTPTNKTHNLLA